MFLNMGFPEVATILVAALLLLGPQKLPEFARWLGRMLREVRRTTQEVRDAINLEMEKEEIERLKQEFAEQVNIDPSLELQKAANEWMDEVDSASLADPADALAEQVPPTNPADSSPDESTTPLSEEVPPSREALSDEASSEESSSEETDRVLHPGDASQATVPLLATLPRSDADHEPVLAALERHDDPVAPMALPEIRPPEGSVARGRSPHQAWIDDTSEVPSPIETPEDSAAQTPAPSSADDASSRDGKESS